MKLSHVHAIIAVTDAGSIRAAAVTLGKTQSALTKQIRQIEEEVGLPLFLRTTRGVIPTSEGAAILARVRSIAAEVSSLDEEMAWLRGSQRGQVRISAAPLAAVNIVPRAVARFAMQYPDVDISVSSDLFGDALKALREGQHDLIIGPHGARDTKGEIEIEELITTELVVITSADAPHAQATSLAELTSCYWTMMGDAAGSPRVRFQEQFTGHGLKPPKIKLASESRQGLLAIVREMGAVCTYPARLLDDKSGIVAIPIAEALRPLTISMATRAGKSLTPAGTYFADCIRHRAGVLRREWGQSLSALMPGASDANL